jgi:hypothetical protein
MEEQIRKHIQLTVEKPTNPLPDPCVAVLFEGTWFFTEDPADPKNRILGICPYTNAPDHICEVGQWDLDKNDFVGPDGSGGPGLMQEGDRFRVDVRRDSAPECNSFVEVFQKAGKKYSFVHLQKADGCRPLKIKTGDTRMRQVSISMPDCLLMDGALVSGSISSTGSSVSGAVCSKSGHAPISYTAFIFVYKFSKQATVQLRTNCLQQAVADVSETSAHLVFRVRSPQTIDSDNCPVDCSAENSHMMSTFDALRRMVIAPGANQDGNDAHFELGLYPNPGSPKFKHGNTRLSPEELGLKQLPVKYLGLASCASGPAAGSSL